MFEVSLLWMGELPYKEYMSSVEELNQLKEKDSSIYETYRVMLCHFQIYTEVSGMRGQGVG